MDQHSLFRPGSHWRRKNRRRPVGKLLLRFVDEVQDLGVGVEVETVNRCHRWQFNQTSPNQIVFDNQQGAIIRLMVLPIPSISCCLS